MMQQNFFELFQLPQTFDVDAIQLEKKYFEAQKLVHPDRYILASAEEKRLAMQWSAHINDAYNTLKDTLKRAIYLCRLHGVDVEKEHTIKTDVEFLKQQMMYRETIEELEQTNHPGQIAALKQELELLQKQLWKKVQAAFYKQDYLKAVSELNKIRFIKKMILDTPILG